MLNIYDILLNIADFLGNLCGFIYDVLFYQIPVFNCNVLQLLFVLGVATYVSIFIIKLVRGN